MKGFHVTVRDLFWLVLVVAMGLGWWLSFRQQTGTINRQRKAINSLETELQATKKALNWLPSRSEITVPELRRQ